MLIYFLITVIESFYEACLDVRLCAAVMFELQKAIQELITDQNGNHVIQRCVEMLRPCDLGFILTAFCGRVTDHACHVYGCRVLQRVLEHCVITSAAGPHLAKLLSELIPENAVYKLAKDEYGNFVLQTLLEDVGKSLQPARDAVLYLIRKHILDFACDKFASNVCEKAFILTSTKPADFLNCAAHNWSEKVIGDVTKTPRGSKEKMPVLQAMMRDRFGNYIVQQIIQLAKGEAREKLLNFFQDLGSGLYKLPYGKHLVGRLVEAGALIH